MYVMEASGQILYIKRFWWVKPLLVFISRIIVHNYYTFFKIINLKLWILLQVMNPITSFVQLLNLSMSASIVGFPLE